MERLESLWAMQPEAFSTFMGAFMGASPDASAGAWKSLEDAQPDAALPYELAAGGVAVIPVEGVILRQGLWYGTTGLQDLYAALDAAIASPEVRAILLSIHSPGGQARGVKEAADAIFAARRVKPCAAFVDGLCASAAYWLASATGAVYAGPSSTVGSVGVILRHMDKSGWNKEMGLAFTYVTAGAYKAVGNPDAALSERDLGVLQARVDAIYDMFCGDVAQHMGLALENRAAWADGRDFLAAEAETLGLVTAVVNSRAEALQKLLKETTMNSNTDSQPAGMQPGAGGTTDPTPAGTRASAERSEPGLAPGAASPNVPQDVGLRAMVTEAADAAVTRTLKLLATVCGQEAADKVSALVKSGITPEQLAAAAQALNVSAQSPAPPEKSPEAAPQASKSPNAEMLEAIKAATPSAVNANTADPDGVLATINRIGKM